ncbi:pseudouridine synthase [Calycina marina]|uniref:tRNA pseudouridine synthase 1 n=1 Tax=Calycina marina TaxID=1763456 RepID=A0A9P8CD66_9HELO|nr:pseudouridine synthase [Calycina marina]
MENNKIGGPPNRGADGGADRNDARSENRRGGRGGGRGQNRGRSGGRGGGRGRGDRKPGFNTRGGRKDKSEMGRGEYSRADLDKRKRNEDSQAKRLAREANGESTPLFTKEEIEADGRRPKRKVAVMIGYAGSGYKGMQINHLEKTIEGDIFDAFVKAGAISKANADDPKKSSLVRCARTDKGVHAAGNVISLKLIVEDEKIVEMINKHLPPQIRVWGIERTNGSFSCYQTCDSRWYEYLIPTFALIPPHPQSYLGEKLEESARQEGTFEAYQELQKDGIEFWKHAEEAYVKPILEKLDPQMQLDVMAAIHGETTTERAPTPPSEDKNVKNVTVEADRGNDSDSSSRKRKASEEASSIEEQSAAKRQRQRLDPAVVSSEQGRVGKSSGTITQEADAAAEPVLAQTTDTTKEDVTVVKAEDQEIISKSVLTPLEAAIKEVKAAYITAKKAYRVSDERRKGVQDALNIYLGTRNFHNYTIQKRFSDPSAKRIIRSFNVGKDAVYINDTEWLSLKVHGQSFMMHQIRKMVAMVALVVRCGTPLSRIEESYTNTTISIPKAPGLGLLLERPVFETYNERAVKEYNREKIDFGKYQKEIDEFKQREIYDRIFREEERDHQFHAFFRHLDHYRTNHFLWVTATGLSAAKQVTSRKEADSDDEVDANGEEG